MKDFISFISDEEDNPFVLRKLEGELKQKAKANSKFVGRSVTLHISLLILSYAAILFSLVVGVILIINWVKSGLASAHTEIILFFSLLGGGILLRIIDLLIMFIIPKTSKARTMDAESAEFEKQIDIYLRIPENRVEIDILQSFDFSTNKKQNIAYLSQMFELFIEGETLCFANMDGVYGVPLSAFSVMLKIPEKVFIGRLDNETIEKNPKYVPYAKKNCNVEVNEIYSVQFSCGNEEWQFFIPVYEFETIKKFINVTVTD